MAGRRRVRESFPELLRSPEAIRIIRRVKRETALSRELATYCATTSSEIAALPEGPAKEILTLYRSQGGDDGIDDGTEPI